MKILANRSKIIILVKLIFLKILIVLSKIVLHDFIPKIFMIKTHHY